MATTSPQLLFRSALFRPEPGEDEATNPGIFGRSLAVWVGRELVPGFAPADVIPEDFGWLVPVPDPDHSLYVACASTDETAREWRVMVFAERGMRSRLLRRGKHAESVATLFERLQDRLTREAGIDGVHREG